MRTFSSLTIASAAFVVSACSFAVAADDSAWMKDVDEALKKAAADKKPVLVEFTGSDWCPPCIKMHKEVFGKKEFVDAASKKFILVKIDIPNGDKELRAKNEPVLEKYKVSGVPTVILFSPDGKEFDRFVASRYPTLDGFLKHLDESLAKREML